MRNEGIRPGPPCVGRGGEEQMFGPAQGPTALPKSAATSTTSKKLTCQRPSA